MTIIARSIAILATLGVAMTISVAAQDIHTEVDVKYNETPQLREINKLNQSATLNIPKGKVVKMPYSTSDVRIAVPSTITTLEPVAYGDTIYTSPYRGYASLGFMPKYNTSLTAGYKFLDTDRSRLNAWLQYDGTSYKGARMQLFDSESESKLYVRSHSVTLGGSLHQAIGDESFFDAGVDYTYAHYNTPVFPETDNQGVHRLNASMLWNINHKGLSYGVGGEYGHFAYVNHTGYQLYNNNGSEFLPENPMRENHFQFNGFVHGQILGASLAGVDIAFSHNSYEKTFKVVPVEMRSELLAIPQERNRLTTLSLTPFYNFALGQVKLDLGLQIDLTFNAGKTFHIAPKVNAIWEASEFFRVYAKATGGTWANTLGSLYDVTPYAMPYQSFRNSHIPFDGEIGLTIGSYKGFYAELSASYAIANDWVMPQMTSLVYPNGVVESAQSKVVTDFAAINFSGYRIHGALGYNWRNIVEVKASIDLAPQKVDKGYYLWRDRAKTVVAANLKVTPIKPLDIELGWEYRGGRSIYSAVADVSGVNATYQWGLSSLGSINNLNAGARYRINSQWSAFLRGENLINHHSLMVGGMPSQGITGLIGVSYKF